MKYIHKHLVQGHCSLEIQAEFKLGHLGVESVDSASLFLDRQMAQEWHNGDMKIVSSVIKEITKQVTKIINKYGMQSQTVA